MPHHEFVTEDAFSQIELAHIATLLDYLKYIETSALNNPHRAQQSVALRWILAEMSVSVPPPPVAKIGHAGQARRVPWKSEPEITRRRETEPSGSTGSNGGAL